MFKLLMIMMLILCVLVTIYQFIKSIMLVKKGETDKIINIFGIMILGFILYSVTTNILISVGKDKAGNDWCKDNMNHLGDGLDAKYWMIQRDGFPPSCCAKGKYGSYERDSGTLTRFIFGKTANYREDNCEWTDGSQWGEPNYGIYEEPNNWNKFFLSFKYMEEDMGF